MREEEAVKKPCVIHNVQYSVLGIERHAALVVISDLKRLSAFDDAGEFSGIILKEASCDYVEERGFSCSVTTDYSDLLISLEVVCEGIKISFVAVVETEVLAVDDLCSKTCGTLHGLHADLFLCIDL